jgi:hypothetical protein
MNNKFRFIDHTGDVGVVVSEGVLKNFLSTRPKAFFIF